MTDIFRGPLITKYEPKSPWVAIQSQAWVGRAIALLAAAAPTLPPKAFDYPNPRAPAREVGLLTWIQNPLTLRAVSIPPFIAVDLPNPRAPRQPTLTFDVPTSLALKLAAVASPLIGVAFDNPPGPRWMNFLFDAGDPAPVLTLYNLTTGSTFSLRDQPNPIPKQFAISLRTWIASPQLANSTDQPPVTWSLFQPLPNPWPAIQAQGNMVRSPQALLNLTNIPFFPDEFPNPRGPAFSVEFRFWTENLLSSTLLPTVALPANQYNWPNPPGPQYPIHLRTFTFSRNTSADVFFGASGQPPANLDWPNPRGRTPVVTTYTWHINPLENVLAPPPPAPGTGYPNSMKIGLS